MSLTEPLSPMVRLASLAALWLAWATPFAMKRFRGGRPAAQKIDPRARWGIFLCALGFMAAYAHRPVVWSSPVELWRVALGLALGISSILLVWNAVTNLGRQWRIDAGLNADHELVTSGAYRMVRHPIYASMFGMLLSVLALVGTMPGLAIAPVLFAIGTEIRIHVEDGLLHSRFGPGFTKWQQSKAAWIPFIR